MSTVISCAITGVLTDPKMHKVPVTPKEMAAAALEAYNAGASVVHCHFRRQEPDKGAFPTWDVSVVSEICDAVRTAVPKMLINMSTGVMGPDISGPVACLKAVRPEIAAMNSGTLNYLKTKKDGSWAWPPILFDNPVDKIASFLKAMKENNVRPECECFDTGILRSISMYKSTGLLSDPINVSLVMGVSSGMPAKPSWLPLLLEEMPPKAAWQVIAIGQEEVWPLLRRACELGGHVRTGVEDTFYLPNGEKTYSNGKLVEALAKIVREIGQNVATVDEARKVYGLA
ncbi:MAG: 3-keto-5-aminohexanoate cleavage protein [Bdellovibrio sp.]|nr:3-keto-5-aminohexanoate cleavage protein [Bdellovibrio sp.]